MPHPDAISIKAVVFDLDGTLIDSTDAIIESFEHTFDAIGEARPARAEIVHSIGHTLEQQFALFTKRDADDCARVYREHYAGICRAKTHLHPGAREALTALAREGLRLGFATSKLRKYAELILEHLEVLDFFEVRIGPDDVTHPKPAPDALLLALERFQLFPHQIVFVGDSRFDIECARAADVQCFCVTTGYETRADLERLRPAGVMETLEEITARILAHT
jgi:phosphoglycolate phosphatase